MLQAFWAKLLFFGNISASEGRHWRIQGGGVWGRAPSPGCSNFVKILRDAECAKREKKFKIKSRFNSNKTCHNFRIMNEVLRTLKNFWRDSFQTIKSLWEIHLFFVPTLYSFNYYCIHIWSFFHLIVVWRAFKTK